MAALDYYRVCPTCGAPRTKDPKEDAVPCEPLVQVDVDGYVDERYGVQYFGKATQWTDGTWRALANVGGALCLVECTIREMPMPFLWEGDQA
jgi:endogenous inhibitor of DNA gyrase (YacG/DUF329 family)